jgi:serine/threonine protein kinase
MSKKSSITNGQIVPDFDIQFKDLIIGELLGQGSFSRVYAAEWKGNPVAVKQYMVQDFSLIYTN